MKIDVTLQISSDKKSGCFYIPIKYKHKILKFKDQTCKIKCLDMDPKIIFPAKLIIQIGEKYVKYLIHIPNKLIPNFIKNNVSKNQRLSINKL